MKYLKNGDSTLSVMEAYAFRYDYGKGKTVLRVKCAESVTFAAIQTFFAGTADYEYYEGEDGAETFKTTYTQYGADLDIHYKKPADVMNPDGTVTTYDATYDIEVLRDPSLEATVITLQKENALLRNEINEQKRINETLENEVTNNQLALTEQYEANLALEDQITELQLALCEVYESTLTNDSNL